MDYNINDKHRISGSVMERDLPLHWSNPGCPIDCQNGDVDAQHVQLSEVWTVNASTVNEVRLSYARQGNWFNPYTIGQGWPAKLGWTYAKADVIPVLSIGGPVAGMSWGNGAVNATLMETSMEPSDVVTMIKGKHIIKFGGEYLMEQDNSTIWGNVQSGQFNFSGVFTQNAPFGTGGLGYADFLLGQVAQWSATNSPVVGVRMKTPQMFVQDDFKVTPHLTLNLGLRYQIGKGWSEVANRLGLFDPTIPNTVSGTLGAMWFAGKRPDGHAETDLRHLPSTRRLRVVADGQVGRARRLWSVQLYLEPRRLRRECPGLRLRRQRIAVQFGPGKTDLPALGFESGSELCLGFDQSGGVQRAGGKLLPV